MLEETLPSVDARRAQTESDRLDLDLLCWWLMHRSELNALSLNRLVESLRGQSDVLMIPPRGRIRSMIEYRLHVTLQVVIELELGNPGLRSALQRRPQLQQPMMDAAYYISRQWPGLINREGSDVAPRLDLGDERKEAFRAYLLQRMNLFEEDEVDGNPAHLKPWWDSWSVDAPAPSRQPDWRRQRELRALSPADVDLLWDLVRSIAAAVALTPSSNDLKARWQTYAAQTMSSVAGPSETVYDALLLGDQLSVLIASATPNQYEWRDYKAQSRGARTPLALAEEAQDAIGFISQHEQDLRGLLAQVEHEPKDRPVMALLAEDMRVLPTTPAWSEVESARAALRGASKGLGNVSELKSQLAILQEYQRLLAQPATIGAVCRLLLLASALAGLADTADAKAVRRAMVALRDGLRLHQVSTSEVGATLKAFGAELRLLLQDGASAGPADWEPPVDTDQWPSFTTLDNAMRAARKFGQDRRLALLEHLADAAWTSSLQRLAGLGTAAATRQASAAEVVSAVRQEGPALVVALDLETMNPRQWTTAVLSAVRLKRSELALLDQHRFAQLGLRLLKWLGLPPRWIEAGVRRWSPVSMIDTARPRFRSRLAMLAHALPALGSRSLTHAATRALLTVIESSNQPPEALRALQDAGGRWHGEGRSERLVLLVTGESESVSDTWRSPPTRGLLLAANVSDLVELADTLIGTWMPRFATSIVIVWETRQLTPTQEDSLRGKLRFGVLQRVTPIERRIVATDSAAAPDEAQAIFSPRSPDDLFVAEDGRGST